MTTEELTAAISELLASGWLPCPQCEGKAYRLPPEAGKAPYLCDYCDDCGFLHPFLSWEEYQEQLTEKGAAS